VLQQLNSLTFIYLSPSPSKCSATACKRTRGLILHDLYWKGHLARSYSGADLLLDACGIPARQLCNVITACLQGKKTNLIAAATDTSSQDQVCYCITCACITLKFIFSGLRSAFRPLQSVPSDVLF
jgi:hypothetical protein